MAEPSDTTLTFFTKATPSQWSYVLSLYKEVLKQKAALRTKKGGPEELIKLDAWQRWCGGEKKKVPAPKAVSAREISLARDGVFVACFLSRRHASVPAMFEFAARDEAIRGAQRLAAAVNAGESAPGAPRSPHRTAAAFDSGASERRSEPTARAKTVSTTAGPFVACGEQPLAQRAALPGAVRVLFCSSGGGGGRIAPVCPPLSFIRSCSPSFLASSTLPSSTLPFHQSLPNVSAPLLFWGRNPAR
ncbi:hypothetical protein HPB50_004179 [Hyalomma asiaticum]|uniref:Uncharacterized protein n=1 Tax=Hyalomma asiaticum TaxID=266040 RepID=A0ACB7T4G0_HYAAI|nr:hypothetical protein HPB50_004179 [Hyalomma asiaticum]